jgi:hypothetical protein
MYMLYLLAVPEVRWVEGGYSASTRLFFYGNVNPKIKGQDIFVHQ